MRSGCPGVSRTDVYGEVSPRSTDRDLEMEKQINKENQLNHMKTSFKLNTNFIFAECVQGGTRNGVA